MSRLQKGDRLGINIDLPEHPGREHVRAAIERAREALRDAAKRSGIKIHMLPHAVYDSDISRAGRNHRSWSLHQEAVVKDAR